MRKAIFWVHLVAGLIVGAVVLVMAATGLMISFEKQIVELVERRDHAIAIVPGQNRLPLATLLDGMRDAIPDGNPSAVTIRKDPTAPVVVSVGRDRSHFVNPYTGTILSEGSGVRAFLRKVELFHRDLGMGANGKRITGATALSFGILVVTGLYLWFPRRLVKAIILPRWGGSGKARDFSWHNSFGFWAALPLTVIVLTGLVINYTWANRLLFQAFGEEAPPPRKKAAPAAAKREPGAQPPSTDWSQIDLLLTRAAAFGPDWKSISIRPQGPGGLASILVDSANGNRPDQRVTLTVNLKTADITRAETYSAGSAGRRARSWVKPLHTGEAGGLAGQAIAAFAAFSSIILVYSGFALAWRRFVKSGSKRRQPVLIEAEIPEPEAALSLK